MRHIFPVILFILLFSTPLQANEAGEVKELLKTKIDAVVVLLQDNATDKSHRNEKIINIVTPLFDYQTMAKLSLGKKYWPTLSQEERVRFSDLFIERLQKSYLDKLDIYTDENIVYGDPQTEGKKVYIPSTLVAKDSRIGMLYKFYHSAKGWKIYDVEVGGVSVIQTYRSQFDGVLSEGTIDDLLEKLRIDGAFVLPATNGEKVQQG